eukprot:SAG11_NODE_37717_length_255_cov_1.314103_1_plen_85_part_11
MVLTDISKKCMSQEEMKDLKEKVESDILDALQWTGGEWNGWGMGNGETLKSRASSLHNAMEKLEISHVPVALLSPCSSSTCPKCV